MLPDGGRLVLLSHGARVLGLFAPHSDENYYWTNPALDSDPAAFFQTKGWHNSGGDRTWLAPEIELSFPMFPDLYKVPCEIDPGKYEIEKLGDALTLVNRARVRLFRSCQTVEVEIRKSWNPAANPLRYETAWTQLSGVQYAGYTQRTRLKILGDVTESGPVGLWNLIQLPHGGDFYFPLHSDAQPTIYLGSIPAECISASQRMIRYRARASGIQKIGVRAATATGRAGYRYMTGDSAVLVVRNIVADPSGEYIDVPWSSSGELGERGYLFQACNVNNELGVFGELEYHAQAVGRSTGLSEHEDVSQVWAFRGPAEAIQSIGRLILSPDF